MKKKTFLFLIVLVLLCPIKSYVLLDAQDIRPSAGESPKYLFQSDELLYLTLTMDIKSVFSNREAEERHPAEISYTNTEGNKITIPMFVETSGKIAIIVIFLHCVYVLQILL